jgi:hypothetical protein
VKPAISKFIQAVESMATLIPFFPKDPILQRVIAVEISEYVGTQEQLDWLAKTARRHFRHWERDGALVQLRGLFCTRFEPADGIRETCTMSGFTAEDRERAFFEKEIEDNHRRLEHYRNEALKLPESERKTFPLPEVKRLP